MMDRPIANDYPFTSTEHEVRTGHALGAAMAAGLDVESVRDGEGNWTAAFDIKLAANVTVRVVVQ